MKLRYKLALFCNKLFFPETHQDEIKIGLDKLMPEHIHFSWRAGFCFMWSVEKTRAFLNRPDWGI